MAATRADLGRAKQMASPSPPKKTHHLREVAEDAQVPLASNCRKASKEQLSDGDLPQRPQTEEVHKKEGE